MSDSTAGPEFPAPAPETAPARVHGASRSSTPVQSPSRHDTSTHLTDHAVSGSGPFLDTGARAATETSSGLGTSLAGHMPPPPPPRDHPAQDSVPPEDPTAPAPLGVDRTPTGHAEVDALLERLADADHLATDGHLEVYEDVHRGLRDTLTALDARPEPPAPPTVSYDRS